MTSQYLYSHRVPCSFKFSFLSSTETIQTIRDWEPRGHLDFHTAPLSLTIYSYVLLNVVVIVQELCESRGGRPGLSVLTSLLVSVDVKLY